MTTLREAAQQALEALEAGDWYIGQLEVLVYAEDDTGTHIDRAKVQAAIDALRAAIEQAEKQEPVAWMYQGIRHDDTPHDRPSLIWKPEYMDAMSAKKGAKAIPLYTAPRQWQGLTDKELDAMRQKSMLDFVTLREFREAARAVEAKLKEKNT